jgi:hypothetical protein
MNLAESLRADLPTPRNVPSIQIANVRAKVGAGIHRVPAFGGVIGALCRGRHP